MKKKYSVTGMMCAACAAGIERTVKKLDGVRTCAVSLMGECMDVEFDESVLSDAAIKSAVDSLGYKAYDYGKTPKEKKRGLTLFVRFVISAVLLVPLMYFSMGVMIGIPTPSGWLNYGFQLGITTVILAINYKFFTSGIRAVFKLVPNMDTLITVGALASYLYSLVMLILHGNMDMGADMAGMEGMGLNLFFESAAMIVTLVCLGKWLEDRSKARTGREIEKLMKLAPDTVTVERAGKEVKIPLSEVQVGDLIVVKQGESIAADGEVVEGHAFVDQSAVTGESLPVEITEKGRAVSASIVTSGYLKIRAEKVGEDTMLAGIIRMVREAGASKAPIQKLADKISAVFVPVVVGLALITFIVWIAVTRDFSQAINYGVSVLVISCPCALGLATPVAVMAATGRGAGMGILFKSAEALQRTAGVSVALLDKTATITEGAPKVVHFEAYTEQNAAMGLAFALESKLNHPLAQCIVAYCKTGDTAEEVEYVVGQGARGTVGGRVYFLGNERMMQAQGVPYEERREIYRKLSEEGRTVLFLADKTRVLALFALADTLKAESRQAIGELNALGIQPVMLTGDNEKVAQYIAQEAGIAPENIIAEVLPEDKLRVAKERKTGSEIVAMVGDGINDSPALKEADVGVAMGNGTDVAIESADVVLVKGDISALPKAFKLARRTMRIIKQNLFWAFFYNCVGIPLAAGVFAPLGVALNPMIAAAAMSLSSLFVVTNALRLTRYLKRAQDTPSPLRGASPQGDAEEQPEINEKGDTGMQFTLKIEGMMCQHCVKHVHDALTKVSGVKSAEVDLAGKCAVVETDAGVSAESLISAVTEAGYEATL